MFKRIYILLLLAIVFSFTVVFAGSFTPTPASPDSSFYTLSDIYNKISSSTFSYNAHTFEPIEAPSSTYFTLTDIWNSINWKVLNNSGVIDAGFYATSSFESVEPNLVASKIATGTSVFGVVGTCAVAPAPSYSCDSTCQTLRAGLVAYFSFDSNVNDYSDYGRTVINYGGEPSLGVIGGGYYFSGSGKYASTTDVGLPTGDSDRSFAGWFKVTNPDYNDNIGILKYGFSPSFYDWENIAKSNPIGLDGRIGLDSISWTPYGYTNTAGSLISDTDWHYFVMSYTGSGNSAFYIDGIDVGMSDRQIYDPVNTTLDGSLFIGIEPDRYNGSGIYLDEIGIWNRALTSEEAGFLCNATMSGCSGRSLMQ